MCRIFLWLALCLLLGAGRLPAAVINGHGYVPVADWATANGLKVVRGGQGKQITVTNRVLRAVFEVNSQEAKINGVAVRLLFPVAADRNVPLISQLDCDKTLRPILYPPRQPAGQHLTTICLDPGHGGKDTGNRVGAYNEKTYTLALAQELHDQLVKAGFKVILTRTTDEYVDLPLRPALANRKGADLFVSLHFNATEDGKTEVQGPETYCITPVGASSSNAQGDGASYGPTTANRFDQQSMLLAYQTQKSLVRNLGATDRGVRRARFAVLRDAAMPAILIEGGYMTHPVEGKRIFDAGYRRLMARAIVQGILAYKSAVQPPAPAPAPVRMPGPTKPGHHP
jgi:N-acetylmuramoyl-L-alanine amidase